MDTLGSVGHNVSVRLCQPELAEAKQPELPLDEGGQDEPPEQTRSSYTGRLPSYLDLREKQDRDMAVQCLNQGVEFARVGQLEKAESSYQKGLELAPNHPEILVAYGALCANAGRINEAKAHLEKAIQIDPDCPNGQEYLAAVLRAQEQGATKDGSRAVPKAGTDTSTIKQSQDPVILTSNNNDMTGSGSNDGDDDDDDEDPGNDNTDSMQHLSSPDSSPATKPVGYILKGRPKHDPAYPLLTNTDSEDDDDDDDDNDDKTTEARSVTTNTTTKPSSDSIDGQEKGNNKKRKKKRKDKKQRSEKKKKRKKDHKKRSKRKKETESKDERKARKKRREDDIP